MDVGLVPWNPENIFKKCEENSPSRSENATDKSMKAVIIAIKECEQEKLRQCREIVDDLEPVQDECIQKAKKRERQDKDCVGTTDEGGKSRSKSNSRKSKDMQIAPP